MNGYEEDYEDEFGVEDYPPRYQRPRWRRRPVRFKWIVAAFLILGLVSLRFCTGGREKPREAPERTEVVTVADYTVIDSAVQRSMEHARIKAEAFAEAEVRAWVQVLQTRIDEDFLPLWFGYLYQQSVQLKTVGYWAMSTPLYEGVFGRQASVEERLQALVERQLNALVWQAESAGARINQITKRTVEVYVRELQSELKQTQIEYHIQDQDLARYLGGTPGTVLGFDANRRVPLVLKGLTVGSGAAALKLGRSVVVQVQALCVRHLGRDLVKGGVRMGGRVAAKGLGGWVVGGICVFWDLADHHKTRANLPVMRRALSEVLITLQEQVLRDQRCGVLTTLDQVEMEIIRQLESGRK